MLCSYDVRDRYGSQFHWEWFEQVPWDRRDEIMFSLAAAGVKRLRCRCFPDDPAKSTATRDHPVHAWLNTLAENGFKFLFSIGQPWPGMLDRSVAYSSWDGPLGASIDTIARRYRDVTLGLEAPNEYDNPGPYSPNVIQPWDDNLREWINRAGLYWQTDSRVSHLPFVGPSFVWDSSDETLGYMGNVLDVKNCHPYAGDIWRAVEEGQAEKNSMNGMLPASAPMWATEYGWQVPPRTERAAAILMLRQYLSMIHPDCNMGRVFQYAWVDTVQSMGVLNNDLSPREAFGAIQRMLALCDEAPSTPRSLAYSLTGDMTGVKHMVTSNADGSAILWVWRERVFGTPTQTLRLQVPGARKVVSHDLVTGADDCPKTATDFSLELGDRPLAQTIS